MNVLIRVGNDGAHYGNDGAPGGGFRRKGRRRGARLLVHLAARLRLLTFTLMGREKLKPAKPAQLTRNGWVNCRITLEPVVQLRSNLLRARG